MDAMSFGMGMSCLQVTFSSKDLEHARLINSLKKDICMISSPLYPLYL
jgi:hypothetical protein